MSTFPFANVNFCCNLPFRYKTFSHAYKILKRKFIFGKKFLAVNFSLRCFTVGPKAAVHFEKPAGGRTKIGLGVWV